MTPQGPLTPPGGDTGAAPSQGPGPGGPPISPMEGQPDPNAQVLEWVRGIVSNARRIGMKFPSAIAEVREINNAVQRLQQKIVQSRPAPEPMAPPV
jgi:hypothetical protein